MKECLVSVIVPTFKRDAALIRALSSLKEQTYAPIEVIVVNDCVEVEWTERVSEIVGSYGTQMNVVLIHNKDKHGSAAARDVGINRASGKYVTFLDDDDYYLPSKVESQLSAMLENNADFSATDLEQYDENGNFVEKRDRSYIVDTSSDALLKYHYLYHITCTNTLMFKTEYLKCIGGFNCADMGDEFYLMEKAIKGGGKFCLDRSCNVRTVIHTKQFGVSNGIGKINGEKSLYAHKKESFDRFTRKEIRQIKVRYQMVLAYAYFRMRKLPPFIAHMLAAAFISPMATIRYLRKR